MTLGSIPHSRLQADGDGLLPDIKMAEAADHAEAVKLAGLFLETADQQHLAVEFQHLRIGRLIADGLGRTFAIGGGSR